MVRVLLAVVVLGSVGVLALSFVNVSPLQIERDGRTVKVRGEHLAARFSTAGRLSGEFMVFGASEHPSDIESAWLLTVTAADGRVEDEVEGRRIRIAYNSDLAAFSWDVPEDVGVTESYWFAWKAFHPDTEIWRDTGAAP